MRPRLRLLGTALLTAVLGVGTLNACGWGPEERFEDDAKPTEKITSVRLAGDSGSITLRGSKDARQVSVHREVRYRDDKPDGPTFSVEDGVLVLRDCGDECSVNYTVDLPAGLPVTGGVTSGRVTASDMGAMRVQGTSGGFDLRNVTGPVDITATSGSVVMQGLKGGSVKARATSGDIKLRDVTGAVDAKATSGAVTGRDLRDGPVKAKATSGSVDLTLAAPQDIEAETTSGTLTVTAPGGPYTVTADTRSGTRHISVPQSPSAPHHLNLSTSSGAIKVRNG
ncbi:DUF4097 family beta strand repeat-containing protein [Streptomyces sp. URMC 126]|uniref:DUF4097 family beta strand repeat-containing protein n=1 Tax=Streptomyces sp. URMC 126 TaxID=3423401 RepID=UPI003F1CCA1F